MAIRRVLKGEIVLSEKMQGRLLHQLVNGRLKAGGPPIDTLSDRELEVFELRGQGLTGDHIVARLNLSRKTVDTHLEHIKHKLNLANSNEMLRRAVAWTKS